MHTEHQRLLKTERIAFCEEHGIRIMTDVELLWLITQKAILE